MKRLNDVFWYHFDPVIQKQEDLAFVVNFSWVLMAYWLNTSFQCVENKHQHLRPMQLIILSSIESQHNGNTAKGQFSTMSQLIH